MSSNKIGCEINRKVKPTKLGFPIGLYKNSVKEC